MSVSGEGSNTYTVPEAARILRVTDRVVRKWIEAGELEGEQDPVSKRWSVPQRAAHACGGSRAF